MRHLGRIGIFAATIQRFLKDLKRHHPDLFETLDEGLREKHLSKGKEEVFSMVRPSESGRTLKEVAEDLFTLVGGFKDHPEIMLHDQLSVDGEGTQGAVHSEERQGQPEGESQAQQGGTIRFSTKPL